MTDLQPCGTNAAYHRHRAYNEVPCNDCKAAHAADQLAHNKRRAADPALADIAGHGKASTYQNYYCRCEPCRRAGAEKNRIFRDRRTAQ